MRNDRARAWPDDAPPLSEEPSNDEGDHEKPRQASTVARELRKFVAIPARKIAELELACASLEG